MADFGNQNSRSTSFFPESINQNFILNRRRQPPAIPILGQIFQSFERATQGRLDTNFVHSFRAGLTGEPLRDSNEWKTRNIPKQTLARWKDTCIMFNVYNRMETLYLIANYVFKAILPYSLEQHKKMTKIRTSVIEYEASKREEARIKAEAERKIKEREQKEKEEEEKRVKAEQDATAAAAAAAATASEDAAEVESVEMQDADTTNTQQSEQAPADLFMNINGREVNVGSLGIDPDFLEALPEDMREEVITQQLRELQDSANRGNSHDEELVTTFLEVLPENVRRELTQTDSRVSGGQNIITQELDPASFFATLEPALRETLLLEQDDETLSTLPPYLVAEAQNIRSRAYGRRAHSPPVDELERQLGSYGVFNDTSRTEPAPASIPNVKKVSAASLHLVDKQGIAALIRTLYLPQTADRRDNLHELILNLCSNKSSRSDILNLILHVLQDASLDRSSLDRGFIQTSNRARYGQKSDGSDSGPAPGRVPPGYNILSQEITPNIVTQQFLEALEYLVRFSGNVKYFFLSPHNVQIGRKHSRKGKSKQASKESQYPINVLFNLLDRRIVRENSLNLEMLSTIIQSILKAFSALYNIEEPGTEKESSDEKKSTVAETNTDANAVDNSSNQPEPSTSSAVDLLNIGVGSRNTDKSKPKKPIPKLKTAPYIPESKLKVFTDTLIAKECTSHAFQKLVSSMQFLISLDNIKEIFGNELVSQALKLGPKLLSDVRDLSELIKSAGKGSDIPPSFISKFSSASSEQAKFLRVLTAIDYLFSPPRDTKPEDAKIDEAGVFLKAIYSNNDIRSLWNALSDCLKLIQDKPDLTYIATCSLSLIESLMIICKHSSVKDVQLRENSNKFEVKRTDTSANSLETLFFNFTDEHRKTLNLLVRSNPKLMNGSFSILFKNPKSLEFDNKRRYFNRQIYQSSHNTVIQLNVRRDQVFLDSFKSLYYKSASEIKDARLNIKFQGEEGVDVGGVTREWYQVLSRQIFNPDYALFTPVASDRTTFHPNRTSSVNPEHLLFFKFIGRIIGKAIYDNKLLDCHFSRAVYKRILGKSVSVKDMETLDLDYYKSLVWMLENDITDIITETFSIDADDYGEQKVIDLKPNGRNIPVTEENKAEYVKLVVEYRLVESIKDQLNAFLEGFHDIISKDAVAIFDEQELELLISGMPDIDLDDWTSNTEYRNYTAASPQIKWFWRAVKSFDAEEKAKLLQFATGTSKVPLNGFKELLGMHGVSKFSIHRDYGSKDRLPSSHTCFNQIDLPEYSSYEALRSALLKAITEGTEGFGFA